jgi:MerR family transcriptional regulator, light-induced transcriptional regulator
MAYAHRVEPAQDRATTPRSKPASVLPFERAGGYGPDTLVKLIEGEIIPRLLLAHGAEPTRTVQPTPITAAEVARMANLSFEEDADSLMARVSALMAGGASLETIYFDLLAPAARLLGFMWESDACSFADVTVGLARLQQLVYRVSDEQSSAIDREGERTALFAMAPGDQHAFGLTLVSEYFRRSGWRAEAVLDATQETLVGMVSTQAFHLLGLSLVDERWLEALPGTIAAVRRASCNPDLRIMVGGRVFSAQPGLFAYVGADATAEDARLAVNTAAKLIDELTYYA